MKTFFKYLSLAVAISIWFYVASLFARWAVQTFGG